MSIRVLVVGKKHESWVSGGISRYESRLRKPWLVKWEFMAHSALQKEQARAFESRRLLDKITVNDWVVLLDERGKNMTSPQLSAVLAKELAGRQVVVIIGGAYGVDEHVRARANLVWSLSNLVFPHQLVRLILAEQIYRAQEIYGGSPYHHG
ncbi:23S rRNA (pseudouridine(1915)-N(3))-methyltransferase RlmH [Canibacter sp. lx-72]|uniref:23S rRNA (pseudouridine(1915)-N(3))-methyltransferase RlmH n=1 Tax=Canibacter zhuwentaonis TaxID=2837491 RepID=UPI001BDC38E4|nr:23S rRNA (pseudouridine(1915)-N(3))-methyltransferase RlmH [Canibacter zhuwentaonis]MBT1018090.1 23S rRNA (pseudouridine(1915)-N(3))-methyltransferase RlmH [Canibacter zhuwentaonis]